MGFPTRKRHRKRKEGDEEPPYTPELGVDWKRRTPGKGMMAVQLCGVVVEPEVLLDWAVTLL